MREVERLLRGRRPRRRFTRLSRSLSDEDADRLRLGIELRAGQAGAGEPAEEFVASLRNKIAMAETAQAAEPRGGVRRRSVLTGASIAAASAVAAIAVDRAVSDGQDTAGMWRRVLPGHALPPSGARPFQAGAVSGFVARSPDGRLSAVSGACTHLGCRLALSGDATRLDCPCHSTSFAVTGEVVHKQLPIALPPLPHYRVRESGGHIEVFLPL